MNVFKNKIIRLLLVIVPLWSTQSQNIEIPDANFKDALLNKIVVDFDLDGVPESDADTNNDGEIQLAEALAVKVLIIRANEITSLDGIEFFSNLTKINCSQNLLVELDFSQNTDLEECSCFFNNITTVNFSENSKLKKLDIDFNEITSIDLTNNTLLERLWMTFNELSAIDLSQNNLLRSLNLNDNNLNTIDLSNTPLVNYFSINHNNLTAIDLSYSPNLEYLDVYNNQITELDISQNMEITNLICLNNNLTQLNINNTKNEWLVVLRAESNPELNCIKVDDAAYAAMQEDWVKDVTASYSEDCTLGLENSIAKQLVLYPNPVNDWLYITNTSLHPISQIDVFDVNGKLLQQEKISLQAINIKNFKRGVYFVHLKLNDTTIVKKMIKI